MKQFFLTVLGVFVGLMLFVVGLPILIISLIAGQVDTKTGAQPSDIVLNLDLRGGIPDQQPQGLVERFGGGGPSAVGIVTALAAAEMDPHVKALYVRAPEGRLAPATAEEIHTALASFKAHGKPVIVHSQGIYSPVDYMAISGASQIWMQATGDFVATGMSMETPFFKDLLDHYDAKVEMMHFYEYKNVAAPLLERTYTAAHREAETSLLQSIFDTSLALAAKDRKLTPEALRATLVKGPMSPADAMAAKLIDRLGYDTAASDAALALGGKDAELVDLNDYHKAGALFEGSGPAIALIEGEGEIDTGHEDGPSFQRKAKILGDDMASAIRDAADNDDVKAIVLRVNSPGGSPIASDQIWAAVEYAKAQDKPVVVSMGPYAASGGYYLSTGATAIVANATTITGSIGVVGGKIALHDTLARFGVNVEGITVGGEFTNAEGSRPYTDSQRKAMLGILTRIYADFTAKVAAGRNLPIDTVKDIAKGRVWSGQMAQERKLVDKIGGLRDAIELAQKLGGLEGKKHVRLLRAEPENNPLAELTALLHSNISMGYKLHVLSSLLADPRFDALTRATESQQLSETVRAEITPATVH
jgi:protease-4